MRKGRWWNIEERGDERLTCRGNDAIILSHLGIRKNWWKNLSSSPLLLEDVGTMPIGPPPDVDADEEP